MDTCRITYGRTVLESIQLTCALSSVRPTSKITLQSRWYAASPVAVCFNIYGAVETSALTRHSVSNLSVWLSAFLTKYQGKLSALPCSSSSHSGSSRVPVYLTIFSETRFTGASEVTQLKLCRISRSSRTLVPCRVV